MAGAPAPTEFPTLASLTWRHRADTGITLSGSDVTQWDDMEGDADVNTSEGGGAPQFSAAGGPNGEPCVIFDGSDDILAADGLTAVAGTSVHTFVVCQQNSWTVYEQAMAYEGDGGYNFNICKSYGESPAVVHGTPYADYVNSVTGMVIGEWHLYQAYWNDSASAFAQVDDGTPATGSTGAFTQDLVRCVMAADNNMTSLPSDFAIAEHVMSVTRVTGDDLTQLMDYFNDRYDLW